jgi:serine/threonine protein kinase
MTMTTCRNCNAAIAPDQSHGLCPACLLRQGLGSDDRHCAQCSTPLDDDARFCSQCGTATPATAPADGDPLRQALDAKLLGHYRIIRLLGRGGMGAVYLARDLTLDREVAVKVVKATADSRDVHDRLRREARTAAKLSHPNIVPLHAFGDVEGMPYFVMGYVRGESLAARMNRDGAIPEGDARRILGEIASALDHAHRQGIIHRDIKPDNVLVDDESGRALLTDFGIARAIGGNDAVTATGQVIGTPQYMSPEQAGGRSDLDARSDLYSLGVMAYAMMSGRLPFDGATAGEILAKHLTHDPPPLRSVRPQVTEATSQLVERCLARDPVRRWPDARSLQAALGNVEEPQLPDALQAVEGHGVPGLIIAAVLLSFVRMTKPPADVLLINVASLTAVYLIVLINLRREGFSFAASQHAIWTEPSWWFSWYPARLRRSGNVWSRMPRSVRLVRGWLAALIALVLAIALWALVSGTFPNLYRYPFFFIVTMAGLSIMVVGWDVLLLLARRELKRTGLAPTDRNRVLLSSPPSRMQFWTRPHIAAVLQPISSSRETHTDSPHQQLQSILRDGNDLPGALRPLGTEAAVAARQLIASIDELEREIGQIARSVDAGEAARISEKIEVLEEGDALRVLLEKQLELIRGLEERIAATERQRNRRIETLKTLALHIASLRARAAEASTDVQMLTDRVRSLCDEIAEQAGNREETIPTVAQER